MNKKEVSEIKSLFKRDGGAIDRICGCLIDGEQQIRILRHIRMGNLALVQRTQNLLSERRFLEV